MLKKTVSLLAIACAFSVLQALPVAQATLGKAEQAVVQAEKDRFTAMVKVDEAALNRLLADDLTYTHSNANLQTKAQLVSDLKAGDIKYVSIVPSDTDWKVRINGSVAIVNGVAAVNVIDHGNNLKFKIRFTDAHTNRSGSWQMYNWQSTRFPQ